MSFGFTKYLEGERGEGEREGGGGDVMNNGEHVQLVMRMGRKRVRVGTG